MPRVLTEPPPGPIFCPTLSLCAICGALLTPAEQEVNLWVTSTLITSRWPLPIRLLCQRCVRYDLQGVPETPEPL